MGGLMAMTRSTGWWERPWFSDNQGEAIFSESLDHFHPALENFEDVIDWPLSQPMSDANAHDVIEPAILIR